MTKRKRRGGWKLSSEIRRKISLRLKKEWRNGTRSREDASRRGKKNANRKEHLERISKFITKFNRLRSTRKMRSRNSRNNWRNKKLRERMLTGMLKARAEMLAGKINQFEKECYRLLDKLGVMYKKQHQLLKPFTIPDAFVPLLKWCIYFDSRYWHSMEENKKRDRRIRKELRKNGYKISVIKSDIKGRIIMSSFQKIEERLCG